MAMVRVTDDEYMLHSHMIIDPQDDCFYKMDQYLNQLKVEEIKEESKEVTLSRIAVLHSRYASRKNTMRERQAHPVFDEKERIAVFHNGFVSNYNELSLELYPNKNTTKCTLSDSELIALTLGKFLD
jgi:glucosamine 6-phosphate synthetase-like amidotransferase/phosphosugar isomerase protein